jgi:hypothetical protein
VAYVARAASAQISPSISEQKARIDRLTERTLGALAVRSENERVELETKLMPHRQLATRITDEAFLRGIEEQIVELERKLREIDE